MSKLADMEDSLYDALGFTKGVWMAAADLGEREQCGSLRAVANAAAEKIEQASALLSAYRAETGFVPGFGGAKRKKGKSK